MLVVCATSSHNRLLSSSIRSQAWWDSSASSGNKSASVPVWHSWILEIRGEDIPSQMQQKWMCFSANLQICRNEMLLWHMLSVDLSVFYCRVWAITSPVLSLHLTGAEMRDSLSQRCLLMQSNTSSHHLGYLDMHRLFAAPIYTKRL